MHREFVEETDIDLHAETRWVAIWELSGRCLALSNALLTQMRDGYGPEAVGTMRILHEAANLLGVISSDDAALTTRWLNGGRVSPREARTAIGEEHERLLGSAAPANPESLARPIYNGLSLAAHNDRRGFRDSISPELRSFAYGPHPSLEIRAQYVAYTKELLEQVVLEVGAGLTRVWGKDWYDENIRPLLTKLAEPRNPSSD